ncbi:hypothetical protein [Salibacterium lacus]|uniref:Gram-positive cocci surface proteins LPxTG domain-containing protein n=1 Tax=Salibacterium lacus TaxID=1898109 RepID=A0ABW5T4B4_9BACI
MERQHLTFTFNHSYDNFSRDYFLFSEECADTLERIVLKSSLYGFVTGLCVMILFTPYKHVDRNAPSPGVTVTETTTSNLGEYVLLLLKGGIISAIIFVLIGFVLVKRKESNE